MKPVREGDVVTLPRPDGKTVDVFTGKGWDHHAVFEIHDKGVRLLRGKAMSDVDFRTFKKRI
jgi:hypothetical protein